MRRVIARSCFMKPPGIGFLGSVIHCVQQDSATRLDTNLLARVDLLTRELEPPKFSSPREVAVPLTRVSSRIIAKLGRDLERAGGRDWEHFATGLGLHLHNKERELVRVRQGEVDRIEREQRGNTPGVIKKVVEEFESKCQQAGVSLNMVEHMAALLESQEVFEPPLRRLARELREEAKKEKKSTDA